MGRRPKITRDDVMKAARATFAERGFEGATLAAIAARLDVSPAALLRHAATKEELFHACMASGESFPIPVAFLAELRGDEDPFAVLRRVAETLVPFLEQRFDETIARWMRSKSQDETRGFPFPFDPAQGPTPPQRVLALLEGYLQRASAAGRIRTADPLATALVFLGSLQSYVSLHRLARILDPPLPLDRYLNTLFEIWGRGALIPAASPGEESHEAQDHSDPAGAGRGGSGHLVVPASPEGGGDHPRRLHRSPDGGSGVARRRPRRDRPRR
jgi:AcrR family transcriptional regulator